MLLISQSKKIVYLLLKHITNYLIINSALKLKNENQIVKPVVVYIPTSSHYFFLSIVAMLSLNYFVPGLQYVFLHDNSLNKYQKNSIKKISLQIKDIGSFSKKLSDKIEGYPYLSALANSDWFGKKFLIPILSSPQNKIIVLDSDTIFLKSPKQIINWINDKTKSNLYVPDYANFVTLSKIEAQKITGKESLKNNFNSGLLCINLNKYWDIHTLEQVESYLKQMIGFLNQRLIRDHYRKIEIKYFAQMIEQSMYWLTLNNTKLAQFSNDYQLLFNPKYPKDLQPTFVHFTPDDGEKTIEYKYLIQSLLLSIKTKTKSNKPWYIMKNYNEFAKKNLKRQFQSNENKKILHILDFIIYD